MNGGGGKLDAGVDPGGGGGTTKGFPPSVPS